MLDDFFVRAIISGIGVAMVAGPLGCFIVWRRMAYFGDTLAHAALLGVALALLIDINMTLSVFVLSVFLSLALLKLQEKEKVSSDALLGLFAHSSLAIGLVVLAFMTWVRFDISGLLFGDILAVSKTDIAMIYGGGLVVLIMLTLIWRSLFAATLNYELAEAEGMKPKQANFFFMVLIALVIAISMKIVGVLLITALLIIPAVCARKIALGPEMMAVVAAGVGCIAVISGLFASLQWDTPSGPTIVVAALMMFLLSISPLGNGLENLTKRIMMRKG